jgi:D-amino-acid dehydrogenase
VSDAIVVGAGVVGACCALFLQRRGLAVTLIDRGAPGEACSFGNSGGFGVGLVAPHATPGTVRRIPQLWFGPDEPLALNLRHLPTILSWGVRFIAASKRVDALAASRSALLARAYDAWDELFELSASRDLVRSQGMIFVFEREDGPERIDWLVSLARRHGVVVDRISGDEARRMNPSLGTIVRAALSFPDTRHSLSPIELTRRLVAAFVARGGELRRAEVARIEPGAPASCRLVDGDALRARHVVLAAGAWSPRLARDLGLRLPIIAERGYHLMMTPPSNFALPTTLSDRNIVLTPMTDGLRITGYSELGAPEDPPRWELAARLLRQARAYLPELGDAPVSRWMGPRPSTPDSLPVLGPVDGRTGILLASGHGQAGLAMAAISGRIVAAIAAGAAPEIDVAPYAARRFA